MSLMTSGLELMRKIFNFLLSLLAGWGADISVNCHTRLEKMMRNFACKVKRTIALGWA